MGTPIKSSWVLSKAESSELRALKTLHSGRSQTGLRRHWLHYFSLFHRSEISERCLWCISFYYIYFSVYLNILIKYVQQTLFKFISIQEKKIKFMNVFHFIFTTSHTFHLVYSSPFSSCRDLQTLEPKVQFILQMFQHSDLYLKKCMCVHTYLNIGGVMVNMKLEENYLFSLITLFCDISH